MPARRDGLTLEFLRLITNAGWFALYSAYRVFALSGVRGCLFMHWWLVTVNRVKYRKWMAEQEVLCAVDRETVRRRIQGWSYRPRLSIVMPIYNPPLDLLQAAVESVRSQSYSDWELCLADDHSTNLLVRPYLERLMAEDGRVRCVFRERNGHISAATNSALELVTGDFVALLDQDDELAEEALYFVVDELQRHPDADLIYSDEDKIDRSGQRFGPYFKPDWNWGQMLSHNVFCHLGVYRTSLLREVGGLTVGLEGSQDYDVALRCAARTSTKRIRHIPNVLYHWRVSSTSTAVNPWAKNYAFEAGVRAIQGHLDRCGCSAKVTQSVWPGIYRVLWSLPEPSPRVSMLLWSENGSSVGQSIRRPQVAPELVVEWAEAPPTCDGKPLGASGLVAALDTAAAELTGEYVCLLHASAAPHSADWLTTLVATAHQTGAAVVGGKIVSRGRVVHASYVLTPEGDVQEIGRGIPDGIPGPYGWLASLRDCVAVSGYGLVVRRDLLSASGGFAQLQRDFGVWDLGLGCAAHSRGLRVLWTPEVIFQLSGPTPLPATSTRDPAVRENRLAAARSTIYYSPNHRYGGVDFEYASPMRPRRATMS